MLSIKLPDGSVKELPSGTSPRDIALSIGKRLADAAIAAEANGTVVDLDRPLEESAEPIALKLLTSKDSAALGVLRHSTAHVMARAIMRLFPGVKLAFGPTTATGYYYDVELPEGSLSEDDFPAIEAEMARIVADAEPFERFTLPVSDAYKLCEELAQGFKCEHISGELSDPKYGGVLSFYRQGEFIDLCRGPHIPHAGKVGAFKLLSIAGAYWKGRTDGPVLQRVYGTAFFDKKDLEAYLTQIEEAKKRDHRRLGKELGLFAISPLVGSGLVLWLPKGATVRGVLETFLKDELLKRGYDPVYTPHIGNIKLYETSGHYPYYKESQFPPIHHPFFADASARLDFIESKLQLVEEGDDPRTLNDWAFADSTEKGFVKKAKLYPEFPLDRYESPVPDSFPVTAFTTDDGEREESPLERNWRYKARVLETWLHGTERFLLKPMNCPHHTQIFAAQPRSYRDLPLRLAEFGTVYRYEQTGELSGLTRVRGFTQDDAHLFCTPDQVRDEFRATMQLTQYVLNSLGLGDYRVRLSRSDPADEKFKSTDYSTWERAEADIRAVLDEMALPYEEAVGEAAFYGPKADFLVRDCLGRQWQLGTVQLDYVLPERFKLEYVGPDNQPHRPVMIHRAPFGSMERFMGILIEHFAGAFPLWLAPEQVRVLPISEKVNDYANEVLNALRAQGLRASVDDRPEKINSRIRDAQLEKVPVMLVVGQKEAESRAVSYRDRLEGDKGPMPLDDVLKRLAADVAARTTPVVASSMPASAPESEQESHVY